MAINFIGVKDAQKQFTKLVASPSITVITKRDIMVAAVVGPKQALLVNRIEASGDFDSLWSKYLPENPDTDKPVVTVPTLQDVQQPQ